MSKDLESDQPAVKRSYKEREKERREQEILITAGHLIQEHGFAQLTMDELSEAVGISKPTLYQHFRSKDDLLARVIQQAFESVDRCVGMSASRSAVERLELIMRAILESYHAPDSVLPNLGHELVMMAL